MRALCATMYSEWPPARPRSVYVVSFFLRKLHIIIAVRAVRDLKAATAVHALFMIRNHFLSCNTRCQSLRVYSCVCVCVCVCQALDVLRNTIDRSSHWYSSSSATLEGNQVLIGILLSRYFKNEKKLRDFCSKVEFYIIVRDN